MIENGALLEYINRHKKRYPFLSWEPLPERHGRSGPEISKHPRRCKECKQITPEDLLSVIEEYSCPEIKAHMLHCPKACLHGQAKYNSRKKLKACKKKKKEEEKDAELDQEERRNQEKKTEAKELPEKKKATAVSPLDIVAATALVVYEKTLDTTFPFEICWYLLQACVKVFWVFEEPEKHVEIWRYLVANQDQATGASSAWQIFLESPDKGDITVLQRIYSPPDCLQGLIQLAQAVQWLQERFPANANDEIPEFLSNLHLIRMLIRTCSKQRSKFEEFLQTLHRKHARHEKPRNALASLTREVRENSCEICIKAKICSCESPFCQVKLDQDFVMIMKIVMDNRASQQEPIIFVKNYHVK